MKMLIKTAAVYIILLVATAVCAHAQKVPAYKVSAIHITPFEQSTGKFEDQLGPKEDPAYLNALSKSLFVSVEVGGKPGSYAETRQVAVTVIEGGKAKANRTESVGIMNDEGKFYIPIFLYSSMCGQVVITARIVGQTPAAMLTRKLHFDCGE